MLLCDICGYATNRSFTVRIFAGNDDPGKLIEVCSCCHDRYWKEMHKCMVNILPNMRTDTEEGKNVDKQRA